MSLSSQHPDVGTGRHPLPAGFTLVEMAIALFVFGMLIVLFGATFPIATRGAHVGASNAQAALLAQHKIDQLRSVGYSHLNAPMLASMGIIDSATQNAAGAFSFTLTDNLVDNVKNNVSYTGYYPAGSTGTLRLDPVATTSLPGAPDISRAVQVTVTVQWQGGNQSSGSFTTHTIIGAP